LRAKPSMLVVVGKNVSGDQVEKLAEGERWEGRKRRGKSERLYEHSLHHRDQEIETLENLEEIDYLNKCQNDKDALKARD
jgi:hypothetical protein